MFNATNTASASGNTPSVNKFAAFGIQTDEPEVTIIKKKKRPASFERRFLSARGKGDNCILEVAMIWKGNVMGIHQYEAKSGTEIWVGEDAACQYKVNGSQKTVIARCGSDGQWMLHHRGMNGFVLNGDKITAFDGIMPGTPVTGDVRAKYRFDEVSILVHFVEKKAFTAGGMTFKFSKCGALAASLLLHFALFSVVLFSTDRVDALIIDKIMTTTRFATMVEQEEKPQEPEKDIVDEVKIEEEEIVQDTVDIARDASAEVFAPTTSNSNGPMTKSQAAAAAQGSGLLAQSNAMNSLLAAANSMQNLDISDWSSFDASVAANANGYGLNMMGSPGGASGLGKFSNGGFGPQGSAAARSITASAATKEFDRGTHEERRVSIKPQSMDVSGSLDKRQILKVVKMHTNELRNCYEKELTKIKGLNGRIVLVWVISPQGNVAKVIKKESTMKNQNVENCVMNSVKFWRFPAPKNGGSTMIEYPFVFDVSK